jgi:hypothetical protein
LDKRDFLDGDADLRGFYEDRSNWNGIGNLWLLSESENTSKQDKPLKDWLEPRLGQTTLDPLIPAGTSLDFADFEDFIEHRRAFLKAKLEGLIGPRTIVPASVPLEADDVDS